MDYYTTFMPVARLASICTILAIAACNNWPIDMFNFHSAFLNGKLDDNKEVFMAQLPNYEESNLQKYCIKLYKSIYGLKQAGCKWYEIICHTLTDLGFKKCEADPAVCYIHAGKDILILAIHVDDCTMTGSSDDLIQSYKLKIKSKYDLTDLGPIHCLLSIKITLDCENCTISLSQSSYINSLLRQFNFTDIRPFTTPMDPNIWYLKNQCPQYQNKQQQCATSLTAMLLAHSSTSPSPHALILHFQSEYSHNLWIIWDKFIGKEWSMYFSIWPVRGIGF